MIYGLYQSAAGMMVNEYRQNVLANNLANAETAGFKRDVATFAERTPASEAGVREGSGADLMELLSGGVWLSKTDTDFSESSFIHTDKPLDVALAGPGFLRVSSNGNEYLTRDGRMNMDANGWLRSATDGASVLGSAGQPIRLNPRGGEISIDENGAISQGGQRTAQLGITDVEDYDVLRKAGAERFSFEGAKLTPSPATVTSGAMESSGVTPVRELVTMIEASRAYQLNAQMVSMQDQSAGRLINAVAST